MSTWPFQPARPPADDGGFVLAASAEQRTSGGLGDDLISVGASLLAAECIGAEVVSFREAELQRTRDGFRTGFDEVFPRFSAGEVPLNASQVPAGRPRRPMALPLALAALSRCGLLGEVCGRARTLVNEAHAAPSLGIPGVGAGANLTGRRWYGGPLAFEAAGRAGSSLYVDFGCGDFDVMHPPAGNLHKRLDTAAMRRVLLAHVGLPPPRPPTRCAARAAGVRCDLLSSPPPLSEGELVIHLRGGDALLETDWRPPPSPFSLRVGGHFRPSLHSFAGRDLLSPELSASPFRRYDAAIECLPPTTLIRVVTLAPPLDTHPALAHLRAKYGQRLTVQASDDMVTDFRTLATARHLMIDYSGFSWMAALLNTRVRSVFVPHFFGRNGEDLLPNGHGASDVGFTFPRLPGVRVCVLRGQDAAARASALKGVRIDEDKAGKIAAYLRSGGRPTVTCSGG